MLEFVRPPVILYRLLQVFVGIVAAMWLVLLLSDSLERRRSKRGSTR